MRAPATKHGPLLKPVSGVNQLTHRRASVEPRIATTGSRTAVGFLELTSVGLGAAVSPAECNARSAGAATRQKGQREQTEKERGFSLHARRPWHGVIAIVEVCSGRATRLCSDTWLQTSG